MTDPAQTSGDALAQVQRVIQAVPGAMLLTDPRGHIVLANDEAARSFGYTPQDLLAMNLDDLVPDVDRDDEGLRADDSTQEAPHSGGAARELSGVRENGSTFAVEIRLKPFRIGTTAYLLVSMIDITGRMRGRELGEHLLHDPLTDLPYRVELLSRLDDALVQADRHEGQVALVLVDLDDFRHVNEVLGHAAGDRLLIDVAGKLRRWVGTTGVVARLGSDEFAILLHPSTPTVDLIDRLANLVTQLLVPISIEAYEMPVTVSIGAAVSPEDGRTSAELLRHADIALYRAKQSRSDQVPWFQRTSPNELNETLALSDALRRAIGDGELYLVYQPQYSLTDGHLTGFEALARWMSPTLGPVSPDRFIPVAEETGLILTLGSWVLKQACADVVKLQRPAGIPLRVSINVSPRQLLEPHWREQVLETLVEAGVETSQIALEITEGILLEHNRDIVEDLQALRAQGVKIVVDDFGRGYSSLAYLTRLPVDTIKIDRLFIEPLGSDPNAAAVVDAVIAIGHALKLEVVAEGVETADQEAYLRTRGCDTAQGFRYSRGVSVDEAALAPLRALLLT